MTHRGWILAALALPLMVSAQEAGGRYVEPRLTARASSTLLPQGIFSYAPGQVTGTVGGSAWCEGVEGDGVGEWLEVAYEPVPGRYCRLHHFDVLPGLARDRQSFEDNGRVTRARIESCESVSDGFDVDLAALAGGRGWDAPPVALVPPPGTLESHESRCFRLVILGVKPGRRFRDTCVSRFRPLVMCEEREAAPSGGAGTAECRNESRPQVACLNAFAREAVHGAPGAWDGLLAACRKPGRAPFEGPPQPLAWRRCEIALQLSAKVGSSCNDPCKGELLNSWLREASTAEQLGLDALYPGGPP